MATSVLSARTAAAAPQASRARAGSSSKASSSFLGRSAKSITTSVKNVPRIRVSVTTRAGEAPPGLTALPKDTDGAPQCPAPRVLRHRVTPSPLLE